MLRKVAIILMLVAGTVVGVSAQQAPWLVLSAGGSRDNQPRTGIDASAEVGGFLSPPVAVAAAVDWRRWSSDTLTSGTVTTKLRGAWSVAALRTGLELEAGAVFGAPTSQTEAVFRGGASFNAGRGVSVRAGVGREHYTSTVASLDSAVMRYVYDAAIDRGNATRWAFAIVGRQEHYGDDNPVNTAYGWLLAPISASARHRVRAGYALAAQDAEQSRWVPDDARRGRGSNTSDTIPGRYAPYYSPHDVVVHSALLEGVIAVGASWLTVKTNIGVHATETAPMYVRTLPAPASAELTFHERTFHPLQSSAQLFVPVATATSLRIDAWHDRTAFYNVTGVRIALNRQLGGG